DWPGSGSRATRAVRPENVDDEDERVGSLDPGLRAALLAVPLGRRDREQDPAADLLSHQAVTPARDDLGRRGADDEPERRVVRPRGVENLPGAPVDAGVLHDQVLALRDRPSRAL